MLNKLFFLSILLIGFSCQNSPDNSLVETDKKNTPGNQLTNEIQAKVDKINAEAESLTVANSLSYQHNDGSSEEVFAYLDKDQHIMKIEEKFKNGKTGDAGIRLFYFENGKRIMSVERFIDAEKAQGQFRERISFYKKTGEVTSTMERKAVYEEDLEKVEFKSVETYDCSMEIAENVLNQKGVFATTFQGFASDGPVDYLIVGGPGESGYASALAVQYADNIFKQLKTNEAKMINTPLSIEFEKMMDERKLEFQVLTGLKIVAK
ncbi:MAG: hypothetical protein WC044_01515 [Crocinitomicaceae bacterium]